MEGEGDDETEQKGLMACEEEDSKEDLVGGDKMDVGLKAVGTIKQEDLCGSEVMDVNPKAVGTWSASSSSSKKDLLDGDKMDVEPKAVGTIKHEDLVDSEAMDVNPKADGTVSSSSKESPTKQVSTHQIKMEAKDTTHNSSGTSLIEYAIGVGAGPRRYKHKSSSSSSKNSVAPSASISNRPLNKSDTEKWPKDIPNEYTEYIRDHENILREAIHQGKLSLCWAVALSRYLEALIFLRSKEVVHLSAQHLVNNIHNKSKYTGAVTKYKEIRDFMINPGLVPESYCPYTGQIHEICSKMCKKYDKPAYQIKDLSYIKGKNVKEEDLIKIVHVAPILAVVEVFNDSFHNLKDGIYAGPTDKEVRKTIVVQRHVVVVCGYGSTAEGVHYWKILNSWGTWWGVNGYGKIMRKSSRGGNKPSLLRKVIVLTL